MVKIERCQRSDTSSNLVARTKGIEARREQKLLIDNPYEREALEWYEWYNGWKDEHFASSWE